MQTIVYQCDTAMPAQKLPNCCIKKKTEKRRYGIALPSLFSVFGKIAVAL